MDLTILALIISAITGLVQVWNFFDNRNSKAEGKLNVFSKAADVKDQLDLITQGIKGELDDMSKIIDDNKKLNIQLAAKLININTEVKVLSERVNNEINQTSKLLDKLSEELDKLDK